MKRLGAFGILTACLSVLLCAQDRESAPLPPAGGSNSDVHYINVPLRNLISQAYGVEPFQVIGPAWLQQQRLDLAGQLLPGTAPEQIPHLLQIFLAQRFKLVVHRSTRSMQVVLLEIAPGGPELDETPPWNRIGKPGSCVRRRASRYRPEGDVCEAISMPELARRLHSQWPRLPPVIDRTGLTQPYDFTLPSLGHFSGSTTLDVSAYDVRSLRDQVKPLGLTVEQRKETVKVIVVDHCEKKPARE